MEAEDLHARVCVVVVGGFEAELLETEVVEEGSNNRLEVSQAKSVVGDNPLDLVEFGQVGGVQGLVTEDPIYTEVPLRLERLLWGMGGRREKKNIKPIF